MVNSESLEAVYTSNLLNKIIKHREKAMYFRRI